MGSLVASAAPVVDGFIRGMDGAVGVGLAVAQGDVEMGDGTRTHTQAVRPPPLPPKAPAPATLPASPQQGTAPTLPLTQPDVPVGRREESGVDATAGESVTHAGEAVAEGDERELRVDAPPPSPAVVKWGEAADVTPVSPPPLLPPSTPL